MRRVAVRAQRTEDEAEALRVVSSGLSVREAARVLGVSPSAVQGRVSRALAKLPDPDASEYRARMLLELSRVREFAWRIVESPPPVVSGGRVALQGEGRSARPVPDAAAATNALNTVLKALERQARLLGLDAPLRQTVQVVDNRALDEAIAEVERQLDLTVEGSVGGSSGEGDGGPGENREVCGSAEGVGPEAG